ncbi:MAG: hypothetical protein NZ931_06475, partial [Aigarchaeota archaeon]|nr:hypothetical protein [Aigarchaeota archaeon]
LNDVLFSLQDYDAIPCPCPYIARFFASENLEQKFRGERSFYSREFLKPVSWKDTLETLTAPFVNQLVWSEITERLFTIVREQKSLDDLSFRIRLSIDINFVPTKNVMRRIAALLALKYVVDFMSIGRVTSFNVMQYLEDHGYAPRGFTELLRRASDIKVDKRDWEAFKELIEKALKILLEERMIDEEDYKILVREVKK